MRHQGVPTSETSVRRACKRWGLTRQVDAAQAYTRVNGDKAEVMSQPSTDLNKPDDIIKDRGLEPDEWEVTNLTVNEWDSPTTEGVKLMRQCKIQMRKAKPVKLLVPAEPLDYKRPKPQKPVFGKQGQLVVFAGDQQAPFHDKHLHELFRQWLARHKPDQGILIGDTVDFPTISRHRDNPDKDPTVQECINGGYTLLKDYVQASEGTFWTKLCGNHDERIRNKIIEQLAQLHDIKRAEIPNAVEPSVLSVAHLLRLDELGIEYIEPHGSYDQMQVNVSPYLAARHGWIATKGSGSSALKTLEHLGYSVVVGHTHRQSRVHKTTHDIQGATTTLTGVETGCMCEVEDGLGYTVAPDWQQGFATAQIYEDGRFCIDLATYVDGMLLWRGERYE